MGDFITPQFNGIASTVRRKRTQYTRRPRPGPHPLPESYDHSSSSSAHQSDLSRVSNGEHNGYDMDHKKELNLNHCDLSDVAYDNKSECRIAQRNNDNLNGSTRILYSNSYMRECSEHEENGLKKKRCSEGVLAPANWKSKSDVIPLSAPSSGFGTDNKVKKVKLKVGGVTRTIQANSKNSLPVVDESSMRSSPSSDTSRRRQKQISQQGSVCNVHYSVSNKISGLQGIPWKDFSINGFSLGREDSNEKNIKGGKFEPVRKSKRVPKSHLVDEGLDNEDDDDDEIRYLEKLKSAKASAGYRVEELAKKSHRVSGMTNDKAFHGKHDGNQKNTVLGGAKDKKKNSRVNATEDGDYEEEERTLSEFEEECRKKKKPKKGSIESLMEDRRELTLTTRQRALQSGKDACSVPGASLIEFPDGLPPAPPRKQKEKLSEVEQQLKKAEAAQRRRMQVEKAARESEAEAIRKILGQDSSRKKREDKMKKRREELAQEKAVNALVVGPNTVRWVMGPSGTTVTFPNDVGLPSIFNKPSRYPPPREKCAGPACVNPYKYRDSKTKLPLCSLQCYKALHGESRIGTAC